VSVRLSPRGTRGTGFPKLPHWLVTVFAAVNVGLFRLFGRRMRVQGRPLLLLTTRGAHSGATRRTTLGWFPADTNNAWIIVGSAAGAATHPAWVFNLARHPEDVSIEVDGHTVRVRAETLHGDERARAWAKIAALAPGYGKYAEQTDREIPVIRVTPA
jgi:deazaflavin-dependent oxidoreductase (nitroreductase family)